MAELESVLEKKLINQLCFDESQWTYCPEIRTEEQLWANFKYILEKNNKAKLNDTPLSESEFAKIKNDISHQSFYDAGKWLVGENGRVQVHVQRGNKTLHLIVLNNEHIAGGTSTYQVINQYQAFKSEEDEHGRNRRFDVTLLINGIPMIHIELKNKEHSYMEGFRQIRKYIGEGKFRGLFSNIQMFVVSNAVDTRYFSAARDTELNEKFISGWLDKNNQPVSYYLDFAKSVLKIPEAHEMIARYTVLDNDKKKLHILRPYQIHAIEAMRKASKIGKSGYIWHTTGSGKTMTSYKATRNLLMDIPSIEKTVFLIDRKDLDMQTKLAFQSYAENDTIDVDETDYVDDLVKKMSNGSRQMIVTTRQKMQIMLSKRLKTGSKEYEKIRNLKVAFVVDECHRAVTPQTKRDIEKFFRESMWYGFTGTPIFEANKYEQKGDLPQTTDQLYGNNGVPLHSYTIQQAIHDKAVLGFNVENLGAEGMTQEKEEQFYTTEIHMRSVLDTILNRSYEMLGMKKGRGRTYEAMLTVSSIAVAQRYYDLLKRVKNGEDELKISEKVQKALPDFPKFAITYSISENEEASQVNQNKMQESLDDYNKMFGTHFSIAEIGAYNSNLNDRLARKEKKYLDREQQLDIVIVVDRLLTGFDAPCLSTLFIDRQPMAPQNIIQAFSRTNRLFDDTKEYGQIITFQARDVFKKAIDEALQLYSVGGDGTPIAENWDDVKESFEVSLKKLCELADTPSDVAGLSEKQKKIFIQLFRVVDHDFAHFKSFSQYEESILDTLGFSEDDYESYAAMYKNVLEEFKKGKNDDEDEPIYDNYKLIAYSKFHVDYEYIVGLIQGFVDSLVPNYVNETKFEDKIKSLREVITDFASDSPKLGELLSQVLDDIKADCKKFQGKDISVIINEMRFSIVDREIKKFAEKWYLNPKFVEYEAYNYRDGELANENKLKDSADYSAYKNNTTNALPKFKFRKTMIEEFRNVLMPEIAQLID